jgi:hypothetical protein
MAGLEFTCVDFSDSFRWDTECGQKIVFELVAIRLDGERSLHAKQPGIPLFVPNGKLFVKPRNADRPIVLLK